MHRTTKRPSEQPRWRAIFRRMIASGRIRPGGQLELRKPREVRVIDIRDWRRGKEGCC